MRVVTVAFFLVVAFAGAAWGPDAVRAECSGPTLEFDDALAMTNGAVYAGRITRADYTPQFGTDVTMDVDQVVRGPAATRVRRAHSGVSCDLIRVGQYGYMVRDIFDPEYPGVGRHDVFFRLTSKGLTRDEAQAVLDAAGLPDTGTTPTDADGQALSVPWPGLAIWSAIAFLVALRGLGGRRRGVPLPK